MTTPAPEEIIERLAGHRTLGSAPREELAWLVAHGQLMHYAVGEVITEPTTPIPGMHIVFSGHVSLFLSKGHTRHRLTEWRGGDVTGLLPYSRLIYPPGSAIVDEPTEALLVPAAHLRAMARECQHVTEIVVHVMLDRARFFNSAQLHDEKLKSLGRLAAGLAHELNNPAAALTRFSKMLPIAMAAAESAARAVGAACLTAAEADAVSEVVDGSIRATPQRVPSPIEEAQREEAIAAWLESHGIGGDAAETIAQSPLAIDGLERLAGQVRADVLEPVLRWVASDSSVRSLAREIEQAAARVSDLVTAVRGFTRVDEAAAPQAVDLAEGLAQTLAVLRGKARSKAIGIAVDLAEGLPPVRGVAAELNQVWANLIDNALDAAPQSGSVEVTARVEAGAVVVRVVDDGPGIPPDIRDRIFDPFFTTKDVGKGTGLGLDIVRRLVDRHEGDIEVVSRPGRTEFCVSLPVAGRGEAAKTAAAR